MKLKNTYYPPRAELLLFKHNSILCTSLLDEVFTDDDNISYEIDDDYLLI